MNHSLDVIWMSGENIETERDYSLTLKPTISLVGIISHDFEMCNVNNFEYDSLLWSADEILSPNRQEIVFPCHTIHYGYESREYIDQDEGIIFPMSIDRVEKFNYSKLKRKQRKIAKALLEENDVEKARKIIERGKKY